MEILIVTTIAILYCITSYLNINFLGKEQWYKNLNFLFFFVFINSCIVFLSEVYGINPSLKIGFVFCLFYGPFLYVLFKSNKSLNNQFFKHRNYFVHFYLPFLVLIFYVVSYSILEDKYDFKGVSNLNSILYLVCGLVGLSYGCFGYYYLITNKVGNVERRFMFFYIIFLFLNSVFFISFLFGNDIIINDNIYYLLFNLFLAILLFLVSNKKFNNKYKKYRVYEASLLNSTTTITEEEVMTTLTDNVYQLKDKPLSESEIEKYRSILTKELIDTKLFLDADLSLTLLSSITKISKTHLTYYFKQSAANGFYDYINRIRVEYSILILKDSSELLNLDEWAEASGFNSRVAFYRAFIKEKGFSPSELIQILRIVE